MQLSLSQFFLLTLNLHPNHTLKLQCYQQYNYVCLGSAKIIRKESQLKENYFSFTAISKKWIYSDIYGEYLYFKFHSILI